MRANTLSKDKSDRHWDVLAVFVVFAFIVIMLISILHHEVWRDEIEAWLIAQHSGSIGELFQNFKYEGHPCLWFFLLYVITRFTDQMFFMQLLHVLIATGSIYVFVRYAPLSKLHKVLFCFGYFSAYEYAVISRNYAIGILLIFIFCALYVSRLKSYIPLSIVLFFLSQTSFFGLIFALLLSFILFIEFVFDKNVRSVWISKKWEISIAALIVIIGVVSAVFQMLPPEDSKNVVGWRTYFDAAQFLRVAKTIWESFFPVPQLQYEFWNTNIVSVGGIINILSVAVLIVLPFFFIRRPVVFCGFVVGVLGLLSFFYLKYAGHLRHQGHLFILFIVCYWLMAYHKPIDLKSKTIRFVSKLSEKLAPIAVTVILCAQVAGAAIAIGFDLKYPFSANRAVIDYILENKLEKMVMAGDIDYSAQFIPAYLGKEIYYPLSNRFGTYVIWDTQRGDLRLRDAEWFQEHAESVIDNVKNLAQQRGEDILLILNYKTRKSLPVRKIASFDKSIVADEKYDLYIIPYIETENSEM